MLKPRPQQAGSHCGGKVKCRQSDPPQAENSAKQDSYSYHIVPKITNCNTISALFRVCLKFCRKKGRAVMRNNLLFVVFRSKIGIAKKIGKASRIQKGVFE